MRTPEPSDSRTGMTLLLVSLLLAGLLISTWAARLTETHADADQHEFELVCSEIQDKIGDRISAHEQILRSAAAFFLDADGVTRQEWQRFAANQKIDQRLPGIQGLGFAALIPREKLAQHTQEVRAEGFPEYQVRPAGERERYSSIVYLEPFTGRNLRAFGYDMLSEPVRRAAMEQARDQDQATLSGKVRLVQETDQDVQAGTLMYVPVYDQEMPSGTVDQRRVAVRGWVYSPYRMTDLMGGILGRAHQEKVRRIHLSIFDGESATPEALLYDSQPAAVQPAGAAARLDLQRQVIVAGRPWTLLYTTNFSPITGMAWLVLLGGTIISLLLVGIAYILLNPRFKAEQIARQLTKELRASEFRWQFAIEGSGAGLWDWDVPTGTVFVSNRWKEILGLAGDEVVNRLDEWSKRIHPEDLPSVRATIKTHCDGQTATYVNEHRVRCKDGGWKWILDRGVVVSRDATGKPLRVIGTHEDITEHKQRVEAARQDALELHEKNIELERFLYTASHDLKSPVVTIRSFLGYLEKDLAAGDAGRIAKDLHFIRTATEKMAQLLAAVLEVARIGRVVAEPVNVTLRALVDTVLGTVAGRIAQRRVTVQVDDRAVTLCGDRLRLDEIFQNLVDNACKFMGDQKEPRIEIGAETRDAETVFYVRDNGVGIDPRYQAKVFGLFEKLDQNAEGTGVGLALVKRIVELHGGRIWVESAGLGQGSCFYFTLPGAGGGQRTADRRKTADRKPTGGETA